MRAALLQITASDQPAQNLPVTLAMVAEAAKQGAQIVLTPEVTNCVSSSRAHQARVLHHEADDPTLAALRDAAARLRVWISIGSLALRTDDADGRLANRGFMLAPDGGITARYDKIHMFDVNVTAAESYRESAAFRPGDRAVLATTPFATIGLTICYDLRFAQLFRRLAQAGAEIIVVPAAFSPVTGVAHWQPLLRARAIETGSFILAAAQTGAHPTSAGKPRRTHGHSLAVSPWGEVLVDAGTAPGISLVEIDRAAVAQARQRVPSLSHDRQFYGPQ